MKILGVDLGFDFFGMASISIDAKYTGKNFQGAIKKAKMQCVVGDKKKVRQEKFDFFVSSLKTHKVAKYMRKHDFVVIEKPLGIKGNGLILVEQLGIIKYFCSKYSLAYITVPQLTVKKFATGNGTAKKSAMVLKAYKEFGIETETEDEIDAFFLALVGVCLKFPKEFSKERIDSLKKIVM